MKGQGTALCEQAKLLMQRLPTQKRERIPGFAGNPCWLSRGLKPLFLRGGYVGAKAPTPC